ncbi:hypothetical protein C2G38_2128695 [Gigaspora rosea]|uniref:Uncharacterized protein n=1 Tax=Gigaspora rosea TaxID=44941 RepID=A0A397TS42_9GLOM|nr:hypothetical protein C2G38_2128695 [Gigaspora rosea]
MHMNYLVQDLVFCSCMSINLLVILERNKFYFETLVSSHLLAKSLLLYRNLNAHYNNVLNSNKLHHEELTYQYYLAQFLMLH